MAARMIGFAVLGLLCFCIVLVVVYCVARTKQPKQHTELDVATRPSLWWADTRSTRDGWFTQVSIVRVDDRTHEVLERRILEDIKNAEPNYAARLDEAQDRAYEASRKANLGLLRR